MNKKQEKKEKKTKTEDKKREKNEKSEKSENRKEREKELVEQLQRLQAEFINFRNRVSKESLAAKDRGKEELVEQLFPIIDNFELFLKNTSMENPQLKSYVQGVEMIFAQFLDTLKKEGLEEIKEAGVSFNPEIHEALLSEESKEKPNTVIEVLQKGFRFKGKVLRTAKVKVSKA